MGFINIPVEIARAKEARRKKRLKELAAIAEQERLEKERAMSLSKSGGVLKPGQVYTR